jgi:hypothetical protein
MYLINNINNLNNNNFISNSIIDLISDIIDINDIYNPNFPLYLLQDICRYYTDYNIEPHTYWVLKNKLRSKEFPNIIDVNNKLILFNSIDKANSINNKLGICINQVE